MYYNYFPLWMIRGLSKKYGSVSAKNQLSAAGDCN